MQNNIADYTAKELERLGGQAQYAGQIGAGIIGAAANRLVAEPVGLMDTIEARLDTLSGILYREAEFLDSIRNSLEGPYPTSDDKTEAPNPIGRGRILIDYLDKLIAVANSNLSNTEHIKSVL